jgi:hypothetical protein
MCCRKERFEYFSSVVSDVVVFGGFEDVLYFVRAQAAQGCFTVNEHKLFVIGQLKLYLP